MDEKKVAEEIRMYAEMAKKDKNIDVASLMMGTLNRAEQNLISDRQKRWAYTISIGFPPFGLIFALRFFLSDKDDGKKVALICVALTAFSILALMVITNMMVSSSGVDLDQLQQINPDDYRQLLE